MTDQQKLTKITLKPLVNYPDATISYEREHRDAPEVVTIRFDSSDFEMTRHYDAEASHAEPEMGLAEVLEVAIRHVTEKGISVTSAGPNGRTVTAAEVANYLEMLRHYLDQAHRETAEAERIGRAVLEWQNSHIGLWSRSEFGAFVLATVREGE